MKTWVMRCLSWLLVSTVPAVVTAFAEQPAKFVPKPLELEPQARSGGWTEWSGIIPKASLSGERISCLFLDGQEVLWIGTSQGRVLTRSEGKWTQEADLDAQVTGVAVEPPSRIWISTSDGLRRLDRQDDNTWKASVYRTYYQGQPTFVSGGYMPGLDAERLWGYVDGVYIPPKRRTYSPFVISTEHGLFTWGGYHGVWHHFLPHYWGANSAWLDTRELIPHRRPTCILEDAEGNLWVGTDGDGIVRLNAQAREYHRRDAEHHQKDGTEFTHFGVKEVGCEFDSVLALSSSPNARTIWALLQTRARRCHVARFDGEQWSALALESKGRCLAEIKHGVVLVGAEDGLLNIDFESGKVERWAGFDQNLFNNVFKIAVMKNGAIVCASFWGVFEKAGSGQK